MKDQIQLPAIAIAFIMFFGSCSENQKNNSAQAKADSLQQQLDIVTKKSLQEELNKKLVSTFYQELFGDKNIDAIDKYLGDTYIQHNPSLPDGKEALKQGVTQWFKGAPKETIDIKHLGADGDLVYIHTKANFGPKAMSVIDIFRIENDKIVEHWDVLQEVPDKSANDHPMF